MCLHNNNATTSSDASLLQMCLLCIKNTSQYIAIIIFFTHKYQYQYWPQRPSVAQAPYVQRYIYMPIYLCSKSVDIIEKTKSLSLLVHCQSEPKSIFKTNYYSIRWTHFVNPAFKPCATSQEVTCFVCVQSIDSWEWASPFSQQADFSFGEMKIFPSTNVNSWRGRQTCVCVCVTVGVRLGRSGGQIPSQMFHCTNPTASRRLSSVNPDIPESIYTHSAPVRPPLTHTTLTPSTYVKAREKKVYIVMDICIYMIFCIRYKMFSFLRLLVCLFIQQKIG